MVSRGSSHTRSHRFVMFYETAHMATLRRGIDPRSRFLVANGLRGSRMTRDPSVRCDWCQQQISEVRYKCLTCPDFDACDACFRRMRGAHSDHSFVKVNSDSDIIEPSNIPTVVRHGVSCHRCRNRIRGARYMCLHPTCRDINFFQGGLHSCNINAFARGGCKNA
ncbi:uncharacterized protein EI90DRAFT_855572 [Cantharellus anzutake]|uniref:uncharacterized protein n=1 Tax=Cantharellus anzutake TaxID=1750568 RepID=UPI001903C4B0|nr:uncharacterized protein EI90DRAFT_855572 [Cantharellus anzutake]KAF8332400.1 hypothetical protein EI90DRAFT_855572 [Cantharellus anzutake]